MFKKLPSITQKMRVVLFVVATLFVGVRVGTLSPIYATAGINRTINFQGKIVNSDGTNVANDSYDIEFKLYDAATDGTLLWTETRTLSNQVTVTDGIFQVALGSVTTIPTTINFNDDSLYLSIDFNGDGEMTPRIRLSAVPYAFNAEKVGGLTVTNTTGTLTIPNDTTISFSTANDLTFTTTDATNITLPTTGTLATLAGAETFTNKTIGSTGLIFSGATTDITTGTNEHFSIMPNGTGNVGIGTTNPSNKLHIVTGAIEQGVLIDAGSLTSWERVVRLMTNSNSAIRYAAGTGDDATHFLITGPSYSSDPGRMNFRYSNYVSFDQISGTEYIEKIRFTAEGNVGIGTTSPAAPLSIGSASEFRVSSSGDLARIKNIAYSWPSSQGSSSSYLMNDGSGNLSWSTSISASSLKWNQLTDPDGTVSLAMGTHQTTFNWATGTSTNNLLSLTTDSSANGTGSLLNIQTGASATVSPLRVRSGSTEALFASNAGNVGIGTTNPTSKLEVAGNILFNYTGGDTGAALILRARDSGINSVPALRIELPSTGSRKGFQVANGTDEYAWASFEFGAGGADKPGFSLGPGGSSGRDVAIYRETTNTLAFSTASTERWRIDSAGILQSNGAQTVRTSTGNLTLATAAGNSHVLLTPHGTGNVGIGTTSPTEKLYVYHSINGASGFVVDNNNSGTAANAYFAIGVNPTSNPWNAFYFQHYGTNYTQNGLRMPNSTTLIGGGSNGLSIGSDHNAPLYFFTNGVTNGADMTLDAAGNLGIGTTTANERLHVNGNVRVDGSVLGNSFDRATAGALTIGNATATSVSICNSAACDTISIGTNADADTINIGDSLDGLTIASTAFNVNSSGAVSGITTLSSSGNWTWTATTPTITINNGVGLTITDGSGSFVFDTDSGPNYTGAARPVKKLTISPEYSGGTLTTFYGAGTESAFVGSMTADVETAGSNDLRTFYEWYSPESSLNSYVVAVRVTLPQDFNAWTTSNALQIHFTTQSTSSANNALDAYVYLSSNSTTAVASSTNNVASSANVWQAITIDDSVLDDASAPEWDDAGETALIYLRMRSKDSNSVKLGDIILNYQAKF